MEMCLCPVFFASHQTEVGIKTLWFTGWVYQPVAIPR